MLSRRRMHYLEANSFMSTQRHVLKISGLHDLCALDAAGVFRHAAGIVIAKLSDEEERVLVKFLKYEAHREDTPVISNLDFIHRTPLEQWQRLIVAT